MTLLFLLLLFPFGDKFDNSVLYFSSASSMEELSESELQHYQSLYDKPIDLNLVSRSRLLSCGLLSAYQVASLLDYREQNGEILSFSELGLIDGFTPELASHLQPFVVLRHSSAAIGSRSQQRLSQSLTLGASYRSDNLYTARLKYSAEWGERAAINWSSRTTYSQPKPVFGTLSAAYYGKRILGKVVVGHFAARFAQGLCEWSAFSLDGYSTIGAFRRNASGISTTSAADCPYLGVASDWQLTHTLVLSAAYSFIGKRPIVNLSWHARRLSMGMTANERAASLDFKFSLPNLSNFGEVSCSYLGQIAALSGIIWSPEYGQSYAMQARWYDAAYKKYSGIALGAQTSWCFASVDAAYRTDKRTSRYKAHIELNKEYKHRDVQWVPKLRLAARLQPSEKYALRSDIRFDSNVNWGVWSMASRINVLWCKAFAWLFYLQAGYKNEQLTINVRGGYYQIDNWDDRIYVYQQDAPGSFNIPAFYGRGFNASIYAAWHIGRQHSFWLRADTRAGRSELRLQYRLRL